MDEKGVAADRLNEVASSAPPAYYSESPWHRNWKLAFPPLYREKTFFSEAENCRHRADIHTPCGTTIEFQHSPISLEELRSREAFYPNLVWIVNGKQFKGFRILQHLPEVDDPKLADYEFSHSQNLTLFKSSDLNKPKPKLFTLSHPALFGLKLSPDCFSFVWKHPHRVWYQARCQMIFDLGGYFLYQLKQRPQKSGDYAYLKMIPRKDFIARFVK